MTCVRRGKEREARNQRRARKTKKNRTEIGEIGGTKGKKEKGKEKVRRQKKKEEDQKTISTASHLRAFRRVWAVDLGGLLIAITSHVAVSARDFGFRRIGLISGVFFGNDAELGGLSE